VFADLLHAAVAEKRPEARWLRGGFWRNFQVKYREINDLHKQMLRTSDKVAAMADGPERKMALDHLYQGQSNDCYWHGLFGGIYISHMRLATYEHLIAAEDIADVAAGVRDVAELRDVDLDGRDEALLLHPGQVVTVDLDEGGGIGSWDIRAPRHALNAVMRRRPEAYHATIREHEAGGEARASDGPASIHDVVRTKESDLSAHLHYDDHERRSGLVRFLEPGTKPAKYAAARAREIGDFLDRPFEVVTLDRGRLVLARDGHVETADGPRAVRVEKVLTLGGDRATPSLGLEVSVENRSDGPIEALLGVEWSITMLGGGGNPAAWYEVAGRRTAHDTGGNASGVARVEQGNDYIGLSLATTASPAADAWWAPIETVSNSEAGFERIYQGTGLLLSWPLRLAAGARTVVRVDQVVAASRDRAAEESAAATSGA